MESVRSIPFKSVYHALNYFLHTNPARPRFVYVLDDDKPEPTHGEYPDDLWASICLAIKRVRSDLSFKEKAAFDLFYLQKADEFTTRKEIARQLGISPRAFSRMFDELELELARRQLIELPLD